MSRDDPRGMPPMSEEDALDAATDDCMTFIVFWHEAALRFDDAVKEALIEHFSDNIWQIAGEYTDNEDVRGEIYNEIRSYKIKELTK
jgi:hypothetical protein